MAAAAVTPVIKSCQDLRRDYRFFGNKPTRAIVVEWWRHKEGEIAMTKTIFAAFALGAVVLLAGPACAETFKVTLDAKNEVPPNASAATGTADIDYDPATKKLSWKLTYSGLSGPATAAHFHGPAEAGKNAGVAVAIPNAGTSPAEGSATLTDAQAADLEAGRYYVNVHTAANPGGEIRGQVTK
jgi:CHRD domain